MNRRLNSAQRAPLPYVHKMIRRYERTRPRSMSDYELNRDLIAILHDHNWRKRDYITALRQHERAHALTQQAIQARTVYCFKRY